MLDGRVGMTRDDVQEMQRRLEQEAPLHRTGFAPVLEDGQLLERGALPFTEILTKHSVNDERGEVVGSNRPNRQAYREPRKRT